jgi:transposase-like protein
MKNIRVVKEIVGLFQGNITTPTAFKIRTFNKICYSIFVPSIHKNGSWSIIKVKFESMKVVLARRLIWDSI